MTLIERILRIALLFQLEVQFASFSIFVCVARIFDRHLSGTLEAGKLRARVNSVKSGVAAPRRCESIERFATTTASVTNKSAVEFFFVFPRTRVFLFSSQEDFCSLMKNKILFFIFFLVDFESDF